MRIGLVACSKTKLDRSADARYLYTSPLFKAARAYCERSYDKWYILSARVGLAGRHEHLEPYDVTLSRMTSAEREQWYGMILGDLRRLRLSERDTLYVHAGALYRGWVDRWTVCPVEVPLEGLGIGKQLQWYAQWAREATYQSAYQEGRSWFEQGVTAQELIERLVRREREFGVNEMLDAGFTAGYAAASDERPPDG